MKKYTQFANEGATLYSALKHNAYSIMNVMLVMY